MGVFEVEADGKVFEIDAPDVNAAMSAFQSFRSQANPGLSQGEFNDRFSGEPVTQGRGVDDEIRGAFFENLDAIKTGLLPSGQGERGAVENLLNTGKGLAAIPGLVMAPVTGAARSLIGRPLAAVEDYGREISGMPADPEGSYARAKGDADLAMAGGRAPRPASAPKATVPSVDELKDAASAAYQSPEVTGLQINPQSIKSYADRARVALNEAGIDDIIAPKTFGILQKLDKAPEGAVVSGNNINTLRKTLGNAAGSADPTERMAAKRAIEALDEFLPNLSRNDVLAGDAPAAAGKFGEARGNYAAAARSEAIDKKTIQAELRAAAANSGQNVANTVRQRMADVLLRPAERRGYSAEELASMERIVRGTKPQNAMRMAGNMLGGGGGLGTVAAATAGGLATGGWGAVAPVAGFALRALGNRMTLKQAERLSEAIRSRSPLAKSMESFESSATAAARNPTKGTLAAASLSAQGLSNALRGAGIEIPASDLLRSIQGGVPSRAEDEQEKP